jgi:Tfp pilus assembly protein PilP
MTMKLTTSILAMAMMAGGVAAQNPDAIDNARSAAKSLQQKQANSTNPAPVTATAKPAPGAPAPAVKPAAIPSSKPVPAAKPDSSEKPEHASAQHNQLQRVNVVPGTDQIQIEISSTESVTPRLSKLNSPDRILVELPETVIASSQSKIPVGSAGVKGVRIGMDGKTPPTTSVVVDLDKPLAYELTPGSAGKVILTLHAASPALAKNSAPAAKASASAPVKTVSAAPAVKAAVATAQPTAAKPAAKTPTVAVVNASAPKATSSASKPDAKLQPMAVPAAKVAVPVIAPVSKIAATTAKAVAPAGMPPAPAADKTANVSASATPNQGKPEQARPEEKKWAMNGKRDPFFSPVVQQNGSGCSTGKKCLEIGAINLRGVVKSDNGFIAVVTNNLNKAYFLRENDPVFNGYVVKITGDSVVFQETIQDKLGKSFTREVVKRIFTPAV